MDPAGTCSVGERALGQELEVGAAWWGSVRCSCGGSRMAQGLQDGHQKPSYAPKGTVHLGDPGKCLGITRPPGYREPSDPAMVGSPAENSRLLTFPPAGLEDLLLATHPLATHQLRASSETRLHGMKALDTFQGSGTRRK